MRLYTLLLLSSTAASQAAIINTYSSAASWTAAVDAGSIVNEAFESASSGFITRINNGSASSVTLGNASYQVDRTTDTISRVVEIAPGTYAPTGVLSSQNAANLELSNLVITPGSPTLAFAVNHATFRGAQVQFVLTFADATQQSFLANTVSSTTAVANGTAPMAFTGVTSDVAITSIRMETTALVNDVFSRGFNIDNFSTATTAPEPATLALTGLALLALGLYQKKRS